MDTEIEHLGKSLREAKMQLLQLTKENEGTLAVKEMEQQLEFESEKLEMKLEYEVREEVRRIKKGKIWGFRKCAGEAPKPLMINNQD